MKTNFFKLLFLIPIFVIGLSLTTIEESLANSGRAEFEPSEHTCVNFVKFIRGNDALVFDCSDCVQKRASNNSPINGTSTCKK